MQTYPPIPMVILVSLLFLTACTASPEPETALAADDAATDSLEIVEWDVPYPESRPRDPYVAPDGKVWFVGQRSNYVAYLNPDTGEFKKLDLPPRTAPHTVIVGDDGIVWIAGNGDAYIGKLDPAKGVVEKIPMPDPKATDPHTMAFDSNGDIWFTLQASNRLGKLTTGTGEVRIFEVESAQSRPYGLVVDGNDRPWVALLGTNRLATVDPNTLELEEIELPRSDAHPRRIGTTSDGAVWYVDYPEGYLGRYDPTDGSFKEWAMPSGSESRPYGMAVDDRDRVWFVETGIQPNRFVGFDPETAKFFSITDIPSGGGTIRHMYFHKPTGSVWFGTDANTIGRAPVTGSPGL